MTIKDALRQATSVLYYAEMETPYLDACVLLAHALKLSKEQLFVSFYRELAPDEYARFKEFLDLRCSGRPVSYIRGVKEFYGLEFYVDERVLVPRPDTETLIEAARVILTEHEAFKKVHDLGTGSGCIAVTLKHLFPMLEVSASDISAGAGEVFLDNCRRLLGNELVFTRSDLFNGLKGRFDLIVSNPPYLTDAETDAMKKTGWPEPELALRAGPDGCSYLKEIIRAAPAFLNPGGYLALEAAPPQIKICKDFMNKLNYINSTVVRDLAGRDRVIYAYRQ
jgi:release factor glutamine methyltransferase